jgi:hypothetical protein
MRKTRAWVRHGSLAAFLLATNVLAHEGHDDAASAAVSVGGAPRVEATSDLFEVTGVVENGTMIVYLDRYATNEPVVDAKIEIDAGAAKGAAQPNPDGTYTFRHAGLAQSGTLPITFAVSSGPDADLLTGELAITDPDTNKAPSQPIFDWTRVAWPVGALTLIGVALGSLWFRRRQLSRKGSR